MITVSIPSGQLTVCYRTWPVIIYLFNIVFFHSYLTLVYQRVFVGPSVTHPMGIKKHRGDLLPMKID